MSTKAQVKANRKNSRKSTGPRSPKGKAAVAKNAIKHGLFASEAVIRWEDPEDFEAFREELLAELAPVGALTRISYLVNRISNVEGAAFRRKLEALSTKPVLSSVERIRNKTNGGQVATRKYI